jgi:hypothetical protein
MTKNARLFARRLAALCDRHNIVLKELRAVEKSDTTLSFGITLQRHAVVCGSRQSTCILSFSETLYSKIIGQ